MKALVRSEFLKLRTTRTVYFVFAGVIAIAVVTVLDPNSTAETFEKPFNKQTFLLFTSMLTRLLILVLGIRLITDEFRHGSIVPTLLASPGRGRMLMAKAMVAGAAGFVAATLAWFAMTGAATLAASSEGTILALDSTAWLTLVGMAGAGMLWGAIGVFLGALIRNQLAATVGGLLWLMGIEDMFRGLLGDAGGYLPGQASLFLLAPTASIAATSALTFGAYAVALALLGARAMRRDIA